jgi:hypothetical protein
MNVIKQCIKQSPDWNACGKAVQLVSRMHCHQKDCLTHWQPSGIHCRVPGPASAAEIQRWKAPVFSVRATLQLMRCASLLALREKSVCL